MAANDSFQRVRLGIVGCGMIAKFHARAMGELRGARLVGCYSRRAEQAQQFAAEQKCQAHESLASLLADPAVQIIAICTPSGAHRDPAVAAARAGKHVVVEKPLEITLSRCDAIIRACNEHGVRLATVFPSRFHDAAQELKRAVDQARFGRLTLASAYVKWWRTQQYYDSGAWPGYLKRVELHGNAGSAALEEESLVRWDFARPKKTDEQVRARLSGTKTGGGASDPGAIGHAAHARQLKDFVAAIKQDRAPAIDGREGRRAVEIILAIYKSAETGKVVQLPLKSDPVLKARIKKK